MNDHRFTSVRVTKFAAVIHLSYSGAWKLMNLQESCWLFLQPKKENHPSSTDYFVWCNVSLSQHGQARVTSPSQGWHIETSPSTQRETTPTQGEIANSIQLWPDQESNPGPSYCETTVLTTATLCCYSGAAKLNNWDTHILHGHLLRKWIQYYISLQK